MLPILPTLPIADASRRRAWGAACVALAVIGHLGGLGLLLRHAGPPLQVRAGGDDAALTVRLLAAAEAPPVPHRTVPEQPSRPVNAGLPAPIAARLPDSRPATPAGRSAMPFSAPAHALPEENETPVTSAHFYTFEEVELPAAPVEDWELDAATLDTARIGRLVFDLFVSDEGVVVGCAILEPTALDADLRASLEARLRATSLRPAVLTGRPVYSVRRIELTVS